MKDLIHLIRCELSGMFTKNIVDEVIQRIEKIVATERGECCDNTGYKVSSSSSERRS